MKKCKSIMAVTLVMAMFAAMALGSNSGSDNSGTASSKVGEVTDGGTAAATTEATPSDQTEFHVGDTLTTDDVKIIYLASGEYTGYSEYFPPEDGYKYVYIKLYVEDISSSDVSVSSYSFTGYADGYAVDTYYGMDDDLSASLSAGRFSTGTVALTVPTDATEIEFEYETNIWTGDKVKFIYDGEKDSGITIENSATATEGAYAAGDIVQTDSLTISYLSCETYTSDNMFVTPTEGCHYVSLEFEFENTSDSDQTVSSYDFKCFADGASCSQTFIRDDDLSATISAGRKAKGTVTFEIPDAASVVEVEMDASIWTNDKIVFTVQ